MKTKWVDLGEGCTAGDLMVMIWDHVQQVRKEQETSCDSSGFSLSHAVNECHPAVLNLLGLLGEHKTNIGLVADVGKPEPGELESEDLERITLCV